MIFFLLMKFTEQLKFKKSYHLQSGVPQNIRLLHENHL